MEQHGIIENNDVYYCDVCGVYLSYPLEEDDGEELLYASEDEDKVPCSFCSEPIGTVKEVYEDETVDYEVANGEPVCISCYKDWIQEWKNDLDMHYTPFHAESFRADEEFYGEYPAKYYQTDEQEGVFFLPDPNDPSDGSYWVVHGEDALTKEQSQKNVFGAEAGKYHITWKDGKKGVTFDFEGGDDMHFDDTWTDLFWDASNPQVTESSKKKRRWFGAEESADDWYGLKKANIWVWDVSPHGKEWNYTDGEGTMIYIDGSNGAIYNRFQRPLPLDEAEAYLKRKGIPYGRVYRNGEWDSVQFTHPKEECYKHDWSKDYHIEDARYEGDDGTGGAVFGQRCNNVGCDAVRRGHVGGKVHWDMAAEGQTIDFKVNWWLNHIIEDVFKEFKIKTWSSNWGGRLNNWYDDILESKPDFDDDVSIMKRRYRCSFNGKGKCFEIPKAMMSDSSIKYVSDNDYGLWSYFPTEDTKDKVKAYQEKLRKKYNLPIDLWIGETRHDEEYGNEPSLVMGVSLDLLRYRNTAEDFNAVVIAPEKPKGAVERAMMNHYLLKEGELRLALEVLENEVQLGIISEREAHKRLQKIIESHMESRYSETTASTAGRKTLTSGVFMLISVASLWRAVTVTENDYLFPNEKKWMSIVGSAAIGLGILALKGDSILAAVEE
jgi:hypothetical protein